MTFEQKLLILGLLNGAVALGLAIRLPHNSGRPAAGLGVLHWQSAVISALLVV